MAGNPYSNMPTKLLQHNHKKKSERDAFGFLFVRTRLRSNAVREEGIGGDLGDLPPGGVVLPPEVWPVLYVAWLVRSTARVTRHHAPIGQTLHPLVEGAARRYVGEELPYRRLVITCPIRHDLGYLPPRGVG